MSHALLRMGALNIDVSWDTVYCGFRSRRLAIEDVRWFAREQYAYRDNVHDNISILAFYSNIWNERADTLMCELITTPFPDGIVHGASVTLDKCPQRWRYEYRKWRILAIQDALDSDGIEEATLEGIDIVWASYHYPVDMHGIVRYGPRRKGVPPVGGQRLIQYAWDFLRQEILELCVNTARQGSTIQKDVPFDKSAS